MPDIPTTIEQDLAADKKSKPYRGHPLVTVRQFCKLDYHGQRRTDRECEEMQGDLRKWVPEKGEQPAHWLIREAKAGDWQPE